MPDHAREIDAIFHGTTVGTNAMLVHGGAVTGMITNEGFRDILPYRSPPAAPALFDHAGPAVAEPAADPTPFRKTVAGRLDARGAELVPLDEDAVAAAARELAKPGSKPS